MNPPGKSYPRPPGQPPPGYREVLYWKISGRPSRLLMMNLLSLPLLALAWLVFFGLAGSVGQLPDQYRLRLPHYLALVAGLILVLVLHELSHGVTMRLFGAKPIYGVMWDKAMFYATAPGFAFPRWQYLTIALVPLASLSILSVAAMKPLAGTPWVAVIAISAALNAAGAIGDLWITALVLRYPPHAYIIDEQDGVRILLPA